MAQDRAHFQRLFAAAKTRDVEAMQSAKRAAKLFAAQARDDVLVDLPRVLKFIEEDLEQAMTPYVCLRPLYST